MSGYHPFEGLVSWPGLSLLYDYHFYQHSLVVNVDCLMALFVTSVDLYALVDSVLLSLAPLSMVPWIVHFPCHPFFEYLDGSSLLPLLH